MEYINSLNYNNKLLTYSSSTEITRCFLKVRTKSVESIFDKFQCKQLKYVLKG